MGTSNELCMSKWKYGHGHIVRNLRQGDEPKHSYGHRNLAQFFPYTVLHDAPQVDAVVRSLWNGLPVTTRIRWQWYNSRRVVQRLRVRCIGWQRVGRRLTLGFLLEKSAEEFTRNVISDTDKVIGWNKKTGTIIIYQIKSILITSVVWSS